MLQPVAISAGTSKSHVLVALGIASVHAAHKFRYFTAADLAQTLYRAARSQTTASSPRGTFSQAELTAELVTRCITWANVESGTNLEEATPRALGI